MKFFFNMDRLSLVNPNKFKNPDSERSQAVINIGCYLMQSEGLRLLGIGGFANEHYVLRTPMIGMDPEGVVHFNEYELPESTSPHYQAFIGESVQNSGGLVLLATEEALPKILGIHELRDVKLATEGKDFLFIYARYDSKPVKIIRSCDFDSQAAYPSFSF